jgi:phosphoribosylglycinamide formyltransferase-1
MEMIQAVIIASTSGSVMSKLLPLPWFRERVACVVTDRECGAIDVAREFGIPSQIIPSDNGLDFSNRVADMFQNEPVDLFVSFYKKLFRGRFLEDARGRLINLHPSILPACPGTDGFGDTIRARANFIGATIHYVDAGLDTGAPIIQSACPYNPDQSLEMNRHKVFVQQCRMLLQVFAWCEQDRLVLEPGGRSLVVDAKYEVGEFAPCLDSMEALNFRVPFTKGG